MLLYWLYAWILPGWLLDINSWGGYVGDVLFFGLFALSASSSLSSNWNVSEKKTDAMWAMKFLIAWIASLIAGAFGPIVLFTIFLIQYALKQAFYNSSKGKWDIKFS